MTLCYVLTHLAYRANAKKVIHQTIIHSFKARGKRFLADVICYCKMTLGMALDGIASFFDA